MHENDNCGYRTASLSSGERDKQAVKKKLMYMLSETGNRKENAELVGKVINDIVTLLKVNTGKPLKGQPAYKYGPGSLKQILFEI